MPFGPILMIIGAVLMVYGFHYFGFLVAVGSKDANINKSKTG